MLLSVQTSLGVVVMIFTQEMKKITQWNIKLCCQSVFVQTISFSHCLEKYKQTELNVSFLHTKWNYGLFDQSALVHPYFHAGKHQYWFFFFFFLHGVVTMTSS